MGRGANATGEERKLGGEVFGLGRPARLLWMIGFFVAAYSIPFRSPRISGAVIEALLMLQEYARGACSVFVWYRLFIAGAIGASCRKMR